MNDLGQQLYERTLIYSAATGAQTEICSSYPFWHWLRLNFIPIYLCHVAHNGYITHCPQEWYILTEGIKQPNKNCCCDRQSRTSRPVWKNTPLPSQLLWGVSGQVQQSLGKFLILLILPSQQLKVTAKCLRIRIKILFGSGKVLSSNPSILSFYLKTQIIFLTFSWHVPRDNGMNKREG